MPVSGLVITFARDVSIFPQSVQRLADESCIELGESNGPKLAIVVDSESPERDKAIWDWVHELPGVAMVEVAFVGFE